MSGNVGLLNPLWVDFDSAEPYMLEGLALQQMAEYLSPKGCTFLPKHIHVADETAKDQEDSVERMDICENFGIDQHHTILRPPKSTENLGCLYFLPPFVPLTEDFRRVVNLDSKNNWSPSPPAQKKSRFTGEYFPSSCCHEATISRPLTNRNDCQIVPSIHLSNGVVMPLLGLGTTHSGGYSHECVVFALRNCNYRMIDTARRYGVESALGLAIQESGVERCRMFLMSKLWPADFGYANTVEACEKSCRDLGTDYLGETKIMEKVTPDCYMIHFPEVPDWFDQTARAVREETWRAMERLYDNESCRSIGVSNYTEDDLEDLFEFASVRPHVNQMELNPYQNLKRLREFCAEEDVIFTGYCPLGKGRILDAPPIVKLAAKYRRSPAQICIRWSIQNGVPAIPKSLKTERILENSQVFDFALSRDDVNSLSGLHDDAKKCVNLDNLQEKYRLPSGYKLTGRVGFSQREKC